MIKRDREKQVKRGAKELVQRLREENKIAEERGAPRLPDRSYRDLEKELVRKLVRV